MGIEEDTHLNTATQEYSWVSSIFYAGYIAFEFPTAYFLTKLPIVKFLTFNILGWGIIITCTCAAHSYAGMLVLRFLLGAFECVITPAIVLIVSMWYKRSEQARRLGFLLSANGISTLLTSPLAFGLSYVTNGAIASWKILYLIFGLSTLVLAGIFYWLFPENQLSAKFLTEDEKLIAIDRIRVNFSGVGSQNWKWYQFFEAFRDPRTYLYMFFALVENMANAGVTTFGNLIIKSFGFDSQHALLLSMPGGAVDFSAKIIFPWISDRLMDRSFPASICLGLAVVGGIMINAISTDHKVALLVGYYLISFCGAGWGLVMTMIGGGSLGSTKKSVVNTCQIVCYAAGNWVGPQLWRATEAPNYHTGKRLMCTFYGCAWLSLFVIRFVNVMENRRRDRLAAEGKIPPAAKDTEFLDLTDFEQLNFRYLL
ncbi:MFS general substrate transporter [Yamadazyma tenuis ATCC 10573]|nr:MFS general substrate transporter [Yamadazyma tenuis ATCC 10573]EGV65318.1 MFS general substrate transporter [Yamadazyma tenuis ATCC 10573]